MMSATVEWSLSYGDEYIRCSDRVRHWGRRRHNLGRNQGDNSDESLGETHGQRGVSEEEVRLGVGEDEDRLGPSSPLCTCIAVSDRSPCVQLYGILWLPTSVAAGPGGVTVSG